MRSTSILALAAAVAAGLTFIPGAQGQDATPTPCIGYAVEDPTGDAYYGFAGNFSPAPADPIADITGVFFRTEDGKSTLNLQVAELTENAPATSNGIEYRTIYTKPDGNFLDISIPPTGAPTFTYGHFEDTGPTSDGETTGKLFPGPNGVIQVQLPKGYGKAERVSAYTFSSYNLGAVLASADDAPDGSAGDQGASNYDYDGSSCDGDGGSEPPPGGGGTPPPGAQQPLGEMTIKASPTTIKRKKAKKGKRLRFKLESSEKVTDLGISLNKGTKSFGKATVAELDGTRTVKLKLKKSLKKKGRYQLVFNGTRADGSKASDAVNVRVK